MKRLTFTSVVSLLCLFAFGQTTEDIMVIEKKNATTLRVNVEDIQRVVFETVNIIPTGTVNGHEWIDLGLPSGTKWATCNVGASKPEEYGGYYAWGETKTKSVYNEDTYQYIFFHDGYQNYVHIGSDIAGTSYDASTANWGNPWCMPSLSQMNELINCCSCQWSIENGVNGLLVTGANGGTIFMPAAGCHFNDELDLVGENGRYWLSSICLENPNFSYYLPFSFSPKSFNPSVDYGGYGRGYGFTIRPILNK